MNAKDLQLYQRFFDSLWKRDPSQNDEWNRYQHDHFFQSFIHQIKQAYRDITLPVLYDIFYTLVRNQSVVSHLYGAGHYKGGVDLRAQQEEEEVEQRDDYQEEIRRYQEEIRREEIREITQKINETVDYFTPLIMNQGGEAEDVADFRQDLIETVSRAYQDYINGVGIQVDDDLIDVFADEAYEDWRERHHEEEKEEEEEEEEEERRIGRRRLREDDYDEDEEERPHTVARAAGKAHGAGLRQSAPAVAPAPARENDITPLMRDIIRVYRMAQRFGVQYDLYEFARGFTIAQAPYEDVDDVERNNPSFQAGYNAYLQHFGAARGAGKMKGKGFFGDFWNAAQNVVKDAAEKVVRRVHQTGESVVNVLRGKAPRLDLAPHVRRLLEEYGNLPIVKMYIRRDPIQKALDKALNFISMGSWNTLKERFGYDTFYHLQLEVVVRVSESDDVNKRFVLQKNEVIDVSPAQPSTNKTEMVEVPMTSGHTMNSLLANAKKMMGERFYFYDAFHNNCQDFVGALLSASGLQRPDVEAFIKQPVEELVQNIPITDRIARGITDLGGIIDVGLYGKGGLQPSRAFEEQLKKAHISPSTYLEHAKKKAKALGLAHSMLGFSNDDKHKLQIPNHEGKIIKFGAVGLGDYILYTLQKDPQAEKHRKAYRARATKIKGDWAKDPYSPNSLAIGVLW